MTTQNPEQGFRQTLDKLRPEFRAALGTDELTDLFIRVCNTAVQLHPELLSANRKTLLGACMKAAQDGLLPDDNEAVITVYNRNVGTKSEQRYEKWAQYQPMVKGILKKVRNSGEIDTVILETVHEKDQFRYWIDTQGQQIRHDPNPFADRGEIVGVYAMVVMKSGKAYIEVMSKTQIEKVRSSSRNPDAGPWAQWWDEMAKKTVMRRLSKRLPMSTDLERVVRADDDLYDLNAHREAQVPAKIDGPQRLKEIIDKSTGEVIDEEPAPEELKKEPAKQEEDDRRTITKPQAQRLWAIAKNAGWTEQTLRTHMTEFGYTSSMEIPVIAYDAIVKVLSDGPPKSGEPSTEEEVPI